MHKIIVKTHDEEIEFEGMSQLVLVNNEGEVIGKFNIKDVEELEVI